MFVFLMHISLFVVGIVDCVRYNFFFDEKNHFFAKNFFFRQKKNLASKNFFFKKIFYSPVLFCRKLFFDVRTLKKTVCSEKKIFQIFTKNFFQKIFFKKFFFKKFFSKNFFSKNFFSKKIFCKNFFFQKFQIFFLSRFSRYRFFYAFYRDFYPPLFCQKNHQKMVIF